MTDIARSRLFTGGVVWTGPGRPDATALLVVDGRIRAVGPEAYDAAPAGTETARERSSARQVERG